MRHIENNIGGRFRYNADFMAIQETALAFAEFLKSADDNFVISGCENGGDGYVWLQGKIRYVEESNESHNYIILKDSDGPDVLYGDDSNHKLYTEYGAAYSDSKVDNCISADKSGKFPTIREKFWERFGIAKNSGDTQNVTSKVNFNNGVELGNLKLPNGSVSIANSEICFDTNDGNGFSLFTDKPMIGIRKNGKTISTICGTFPTASLYDIIGTTPMPALNGKEISINDETNARQYILDSKDIKKVLQMPKYIKNTDWLSFINTKDNSAYEKLKVRQIKDKIFIRGQIDKKYIVNNYDETNFDNVIEYGSLLGNNELVTEISSFNTKSVDYEGNNISEYGKIVKLKLKLKLPDEISLPDDDILPGCMIMSRYPENYLKQNANPSDYYSLGNAQLQLGSDGFLYLIIGTGYKMYFGNLSPYINFNYIV